MSASPRGGALAARILSIIENGIRYCMSADSVLPRFFVHVHADAVAAISKELAFRLVI